jgi:hypothetical protein
MIPLENITTKRVVNKMLVCLTCKKAAYKRITGGTISFLDNCTLTENCSGRMVRDANQQQSPRSELTWREKTRVFKHSFVDKQIVEIPHQFGHLGSVIIEPFVSVSNGTSVTTIKQMAFTIVAQTAYSITIDLGYTRTGTIVVTDNQYRTPVKHLPPTVVTSPPLLFNNRLTIAVDRNLPTIEIPIRVKLLSSTNYTTTTLVFEGHAHSTNRVISQSPWNQYSYIALEKPYFLYSATLPQSLLARGSTLQLMVDGDWLIPLTTAPSITAADIVKNVYWKGTDSEFGSLVAESYQLILSNPASMTTIPKQYILV